MPPKTEPKKLTCKHPGGPGVLLLYDFTAERMGLDRWDPEYYDPKYRSLFRDLKRRRARPLGDYIESITYGQVGERRLAPAGIVRYLQVINLQETGIDFALKPDRVKEGSHNDPERSRVRVGDILLTNTSFGGMSRLLGRSVAVVSDYGKINVSQDIDVIRCRTLDPAFVCVFLKGRYGQEQMERFQHGVKSSKISFGNVREILIPPAPKALQSQVRSQYLAVTRWHEKAMARKEEIAGRGTRALRKGALKKAAEEDREYLRRMSQARRRLEHLIRQVERYVSGETETLLPYRG